MQARSPTTTSDPLSQTSALAAYRGVRSFSEQLCEPLATEDYVVQSAVETSPPKWHLAHVTWFFETFLLIPYLRGYRAFHPHFDHLFNSYYEQLEGGYWPRPERGLLSRPTVAEVYAYRRHVDEAMTRLIEAGDRSCWEAVRRRLEIGLKHEQQHQELLLTDIKHNFAINPMRPAYRADLPADRPTDPDALRWSTFEGGLVAIGGDGGGFAYDNELPRHRVFLEPYRLADRLVTNGELLRFMEDGGYDQPGLWLSDGWQRVRGEGWRAPLYWEQLDGEWHEMTLAGLRPLNPGAPVVHVS